MKSKTTNTITKDMNISLEGQRALVTGGNSGIDEAIATALANARAKVVINHVILPAQGAQLGLQLAGGLGPRSRTVLFAPVSQISIRTRVCLCGGRRSISHGVTADEKMDL